MYFAIQGAEQYLLFNFYYSPSTLVP